MTERKRAIFRANFYGCHVNASCGYILFGEFFKIYIYIIPTLNCFKENRLTYNVDARARSLFLSFSCSLFWMVFHFFFSEGFCYFANKYSLTHSHIHGLHTQRTALKALYIAIVRLAVVWRGLAWHGVTQSVLPQQRERENESNMQCVI